MKTSKYETTLSEIRNSNMVAPGEILIIGEKTSSSVAGAMFGPITPARVDENLPVCIVAVSSSMIKIFEINRKSAKYSGTVIQINVSDINKIKITRFIQKSFSIKYKNESYKIITGKKYFDIPQEEELKKAFRILNSIIK